MTIPATNRQSTTIRAIRPADAPRLVGLMESAWRVAIRISPVEFHSRIRTLPGVLAEDPVGVRGFIQIEAAPPLAFLVALGVRDTWHLTPYLDLLLPAVEKLARRLQADRLVYIGGDEWLIQPLLDRGFTAHEWVTTLERPADLPLPAVAAVARLRTAHRLDLSRLTHLDALAFGELWHKAIGQLAEGLAQAALFLLAEMEGQIVGYIWCDIYRSHAHITRLAVHPAYQGRGIGRQLLHCVLSEAIAQGAARITLNTQEHNLRAMTLYRRFGFTPTDMRMPLLVKPLG
ncbi:MAG: GNAT family N-acetyltransferase [Chloroflexi bacterium]|nr:MAG: GNAT family N-acetyltransferase [Chloroflexota bacterium]